MNYLNQKRAPAYLPIMYYVLLFPVQLIVPSTGHHNIAHREHRILRRNDHAIPNCIYITHTHTRPRKQRPTHCDHGLLHRVDLVNWLHRVLDVLHRDAPLRNRTIEEDGELARRTVKPIHAPF